MDGSKFDAAVKQLGNGNSRRSVLRLLARGAGAGILTMLGANQVSAQPACRREGHPCEGNRTCCEGLTCVASGPGSARRCTANAECEGDCPPAGQVVVIDVDIDIEADCEYSGEMRHTICTFTAASGKGTVESLTVPESLLCAEVLDGEFDEVDLGANARPSEKSKGFKSRQSENGVAAVTLKLAGEVTTLTTATYWCETEAAVLIPVTGPGLQCEEATTAAVTDVSESAGAVMIQLYTCDVAGDMEDVDWYEVCEAPDVEVTFRLEQLDGGDWKEVGAQSTNQQGLCGFANLPPGTYRLQQTSGAWCHAESDRVDEQGHVIVDAGVHTTVWVFHCDAGK